MSWLLAIDPGAEAWLAGLLEGEGCFWAQKPSGPKSGSKRIPSIKLAMTDRDVVERYAELVGASTRLVRKRGTMKQDQYQCNVNGWRAVEVMERVLPMMGERRAARIRELLSSDWVTDPSPYHPRPTLSASAAAPGEPGTWILAVDPGSVHVGWALLREGETRACSGEVHNSEAADWLADEIKRLGDGGLVVIEEFRLYGGETLGSQIWEPMLTSELIGALKYVAAKSDTPVIEQGALIKKPMEAQLRARGIELLGKGRHAKDAELHLYHRWLRFGFGTEGAC